MFLPRGLQEGALTKVIYFSKMNIKTILVFASLIQLASQTDRQQFLNELTLQQNPKGQNIRVSTFHVSSLLYVSFCENITICSECFHEPWKYEKSILLFLLSLKTMKKVEK